MTEFSDDTLDTSDATEAGIGSSDDFFEGLGEAFMDQVESLELGEDGSIDMQVRLPESESEAPQDGDPASSTDTSDQPGSGKPSADAAFLEGQYKEVQGWATRVSQENAELKERLSALEQGMDHGSTSSAGDDGDETNLDPETQAMFDSYMEKNLGTVLSQKLGVAPEELGEMLREAAINRDLRAAYAKYEDFDAYIPAMAKISEKYPNLNYDQLYDLATTFYKPAAEGDGEQTDSVEAPETAAPPATTQQQAPQPSQPQETPEQRAQRLQTLESKSNDEGYEPGTKVTSIQAAAEKALREMNG